MSIHRVNRASLSLIVLHFILFASTRAQESSIPQVQTAIISSEQLPVRFDETVTFECLSFSVNAESLLTEFSKSGILFTRAWLPLDNRCTDMIGPRFTVELASNDVRIIEFGFKRGAGRLHCASQLKQFSIEQ